MADKTIASFQKSGFEEVRATIGEFKGKRRANVRVYADYHGKDEYGPTNKVISLKLDHGANLKKVVNQLFDAATKELEKED